MELWKQRQELANETYRWITDYLLQHQFQFPGCNEEEPMERETLMNWIDLPSIFPVLSAEQISSVDSLFYQKACFYVEGAAATTVMDVRQHRINKCASIVKGIAILYQNSPALHQRDVRPWIALCENAMRLSCSARDDCISLSQLWVLLSLFPQAGSPSTAAFVGELARLVERVHAGSQLRLMLYRQLLIHFSLSDLLPLSPSVLQTTTITSSNEQTINSSDQMTTTTHTSSDQMTTTTHTSSDQMITTTHTSSDQMTTAQQDGGFLRSLQETVSTMAVNTVDESVSQVEVMGMLVATYVKGCAEIPPSCAEATLQLLVQDLNSSARKLTKQSEDVLSLVIRSASVASTASYHL